MSSRERVLAAVRGLPVDRVPVMYWLNSHLACRLVAEHPRGGNGIARFLARRLWRGFVRRGGIAAGEWSRALPLLLDEYGNSEYALALGADICVLSPGVVSPSAFVRSIRRQGGRLRITGPFGVTLGIGGVYAEVVEHPVKDPRDLAGYELPRLAAIRRGPS